MRRLLLGVFGVLAMTGAAVAQTYPTRSVEVVFPFTPGSPLDLLGRALVEEMGNAFGQSLVPVNRDAAAGIVAARAVAGAKPDGYTIGFTVVGPITIQTHYDKNIGYTADSFEYVCQTFDVPFVVAVREESPFRGLPDLVAEAKRRPGALNFGVNGKGTTPHLSIAQFALASGIDVVHIAYRGDIPAITAMKASEVDFGAFILGSAMAQNLRVLATFSAARDPVLPTAPTMTELGIPVVSTISGGILAPKGTPADVLQRLEAGCAAALRASRYLRVAETTKQPVAYRDGAAFAEAVRKDWAAKGDVIRRAKLDQ